VQKGSAVAVKYAFEIAVRCAPEIGAPATISFASLRKINPRAIIGLVFIENGVAFIITGFTDQPTEDTTGIIRVNYS